MMKRILKRVCLIPMALLILCSFGVCAAESGEPDYKVGLEIAFNHSEYVKGETATATIKLTGLSSLDYSKDKIGAFEAYIKYNINDVVPMYDGAEVTEQDKTAGVFDSALDEVSGKHGFNTAAKQMGYLTSDERIIVVYFEESNGVALSADSFAIGRVSFKIKKEAGAIGASIYSGAVYRPYKGEGGSEEVSGLPIKIDAFTNASASVVNAILEPGTAKLDENNTVKTEGLRVAASDNNGILIAQLYDKNTGLTKATQVIPDLSKASVSFNVSKIIDKSKLEVRYYLWNSFSGMKALAESKAAEVK